MATSTRCGLPGCCLENSRARTGMDQRMFQTKRGVKEGSETVRSRSLRLLLCIPHRRKTARLGKSTANCEETTGHLSLKNRVMSFRFCFIASALVVASAPCNAQSTFQINFDGAPFVLPGSGIV